MNIVEHSKCHKCGKILNITDLKDNDVGIGKICCNTEDCKKRINNNNVQTK